jgi:hypothetical protein
VRQLLVLLLGVAWAADTGEDTGLAAPPPVEAAPAVDVPPTGAAWSATDELERRWEDLDKDGQPDAVEEVASLGSGFHSFRTCVRLTADGHVACRSWADTAYSGFFGVAVEAVSPKVGNTAAAALSLACAAADERAPAQGAMWRLRHAGPWPEPWDGEGQPPDTLLKPAPVTWRPGPVVAQTRVCLDGSVAKRFPGAFAWGEGEPAAPGWQVMYRSAEVKEVLRDERQVIFATRHALAVYDLATDRHAWFVQLESAWLGFKYDRWDAIEDVSWSERGVVQLGVASMLVNHERMRVKVPQP